jgi:HSP20 family molecular chaperone IbpA
MSRDNWYEYFSYKTTRDSRCRLETDKIVLEVPGYGERDLRVVLKGSLLKVTGKKGEKDLSYKFRLSKSTDLDKVEVNVENGLLTILLPPKKEEKGKERVLL